MKMEIAPCIHDKKVVEKNSINVLEYKFMIYLAGVNTKKFCFTSNTQRELAVKSILSFVKERVKQEDVDKISPIWDICLKIRKLDFDNLESVEHIYSELFKLSNKKSSKYYKILGKEDIK